jgi:hypothetical protein
MHVKWLLFARAIIKINLMFEQHSDCSTRIIVILQVTLIQKELSDLATSSYNISNYAFKK